MTVGFSGIEGRVKDACRARAKDDTRNLIAQIAAKLGHPRTSYGYPQEFDRVIAELEKYAQRRFETIHFQKVWDEAEAAALASVKAKLEGT